MTGRAGKKAGLMLLAALGAPIAAAQQSPAARSAPARIPVEAFAQLPFLSDPALSPDGKKIAAKVFVDGKESIAIYEVDGPPGQSPKLYPLSSGTLRSFQWAGNERLLIGTGVLLVLAGVAIPFSTLTSYNIATGKNTPVGRGKGLIGDNVIFVDPDGRYILLASQKDLFTSPSVDRVSLVDGTVTQVQKRQPGVWTWFADPSGFVRGGVDYGERRLKLYYRARPEEELRRIETRKYQTDEGVIESVRFLGGDGLHRGVVLTNAQTGRFGVYEYDFATDAMGKVIFEHPSVDVTSIVTGADGVDGVAYDEEKPRIHWLNPELARLQQRIDRTLPGKTNLVSGQSRDGNVVLLWSGGADDPGTWFVYNRSAKRMASFARPYDRLDGAALAPVKPVTYRARDGLSIPGYLTLPPGRKAEGLPLIVMPHGGPFARDSWTFSSEVQFLASRGYAVLQPNFRGSTGYGLDYVNRGHGQIGTGMIDDVEDGAKWLIADGVVDPKKVCIMGTSYGGYAAIWSAIRNPELYRCAISMAGVTDWKTMLKHDARFLMPRRYYKQWRAQIEGAERSDLAAVSPVKHASKLKVPLLIAHGEQDFIVPATHSRELVKALSGARSPVVSVFYPKAGHGFSWSEDAADYLKRVEAFLAAHNPS